MQNFKEYVNEILKNHPGERVTSFSFEGEKYWLKQPELRIRGGLLTKIFKANPKASFDYEALKCESLYAASAPVPQLVLRDESFFVLKDGGTPVDEVLKSSDEAACVALIQGYAAALAHLHSRGFIHGRPALRDVLVKNGEMKFIDFENRGERDDLQKAKMRDFLLFVYDLCREGLSEGFVRAGIHAYASSGEQDVVQSAWATVLALRPIYFIARLLPQKFKDLNAFVRTFELCLKIIEKNDGQTK